MMGKRVWSDGTRRMSLARRSNSGTKSIFCPIGAVGSSTIFIASVGSGYLREMTWMIRTPTEKMSSLSV